MSTEEMIAQFLAKGGTVTKVAEGARNMTEREVYRAIGYEPEKEQVFYILTHDECGTAETRRQKGRSKRDAEERFQSDYPEHSISDVLTYAQYETWERNRIAYLGREWELGE